jgi:hypothetical protein
LIAPVRTPRAFCVQVSVNVPETAPPYFPDHDPPSFGAALRPVAAVTPPARARRATANTAVAMEILRRCIGDASSVPVAS